jgi:hypothetical protein
MGWEALAMESRYVHKSHNVSVLMYHVMCAAKKPSSGDERASARLQALSNGLL